ncbi:MAG: glycosyltransferase [Candidatus Krumholzibacteriota bacterium]|nr:glycosyltransferase [Candidatus Krumholzibacteriota bacterium]
MLNSPDSGKIFFLASSLVTGGAEVIVRDLAEYISYTGFEVQFLCLHRPGQIGRELIDSGFEVKSGISRGRFDFGTYFRLFRIFNKNKEAVLFSLDHHNAIFWGALAAKAARLNKTVLSLHSTRLSGEDRNFNIIDRLVLPVYKKIIALSKRHAEYLVEEEGINKGRVTIINNGVDIHRFHPIDSEGERKEYKRKFSIPENNLAVTIVAAIRPEKNHDIFLDAAFSISKKRRDITFIIAGDGKGRMRLEKKVDEMSIKDRVIFLGNRNDIPEILSATDISVLCSDMEILPLTVLEAMSAGLPVISTDVGSLSEIIRNGRDGVLIDSKDAVSLAGAIEKLADDKGTRLEMGKSARERILERFTKKTMLKQYKKLFKELSFTTKEN